jgi:DNA-binding NarL/FixJ family response regulator
VIRVVIADDHPHVRSALRHVLELEADFEVVAEAQNGMEAVIEVLRTRPDLVILDYRMPKLNGIEVAREIGREVPTTAMVMLTSEDDAVVRAEAASAGIARYLLKSGRADELVRTLRAASTGGDPIAVIVKPESRPAAEQQLPPTRTA